MNTITATKRVVVYGSHNGWTTAPGRVRGEGREVELTLRIMGNAKEGFHLCMRPEGFFEADCWYETLDEAKQDAKEAYGVTEADWS